MAKKNIFERMEALRSGRSRHRVVVDEGREQEQVITAKKVVRRGKVEKPSHVSDAILLANRSLIEGTIQSSLPEAPPDLSSEVEALETVVNDLGVFFENTVNSSLTECNKQIDITSFVFRRFERPGLAFFRDSIPMQERTPSPGLMARSRREDSKPSFSEEREQLPHPSILKALRLMEVATVLRSNVDINLSLLREMSELYSFFVDGDNVLLPEDDRVSFDDFSSSLAYLGSVIFETDRYVSAYFRYVADFLECMTSLIQWRSAYPSEPFFPEYIRYIRFCYEYFSQLLTTPGFHGEYSLDTLQNALNAAAGFLELELRSLRPHPRFRNNSYQHVGWVPLLSQKSVAPTVRRSSEVSVQSANLNKPVIKQKSWARRLVSTAMSRAFGMVFNNKLPRRLVMTAGVSVFALGVGYGVARYYGDRYADQILSEGKKKLAVGIISGGELVGYVYGEQVNADQNVKGIDRSVLIPERELQHGGQLYYAYQALMEVEDRHHDGGISDVLGINPVAIAKAAVKKVTHEAVGIPKRDPGGASTLADQTCGAIQSGLPFILDTSYIYEKAKRVVPFDVKAVDTVCGMSLAARETPEAIAAWYFTFGFFANNAQGVEPFIRSYWGFDGIHDPRMTIGHQAVLASLIRWTWKSGRFDPGDGSAKSQKIRHSQQQRWERKTIPRAKLAVDRLIDKGVLTLDSLKKLGADMPSVYPTSPQEIRKLIQKIVYSQIEDAMPRTYREISATPQGYHLYPKHGYNYLIQRGIHEAENVFGDHFREEVQTLELTSNGYVQGNLIRALRRELVRVAHPEARGIGLLVNDHTGEMIAGFSGKLTDDGQDVEYDYRDRIFDDETELGSLGKLFLAAAIARKGYAPDSPEKLVRRFRSDLKHSERRIVADARRLGMSEEYVGDLINTFGEMHANQGRKERDYFDEAAMGTFSTTPARMVGLMKAAREGYALDPIRVVDTFHMRDGSKCTYGEQGDLVCVNGHRVERQAVNLDLYEGFGEYSRRITILFSGLQEEPWDWFAIPLAGEEDWDVKPGTLHILQDVVDGGKTGTVGKKNTTTKGAWVLVGTEPEYDDDGNLVLPGMSGIFGIAADGYEGGDGSIINLGNDLQGGTHPARVARETLVEAQRRLKK